MKSHEEKAYRPILIAGALFTEDKSLPCVHSMHGSVIIGQGP